MRLIGMDLVADGIPANHAAPTHLVTEAPIQISRVAPDTYLVDFGRVAFGNLRLTPPAHATGEVTIHFGCLLAVTL